LQQRLGLTYLFIAHDLSMIRFICTRVAVMYRGKIVEIAETNELYSNLLHPYTKVLLSAVPIPDPDIEANRGRIIMDLEFEYGEKDSRMVEVRPGHFLAASRAEAAVSA
jgi:ABC-type oligopeptide transport system ATPase subunit